jgi:hypothetical protein
VNAQGVGQILLRHLEDAKGVAQLVRGHENGQPVTAQTMRMNPRTAVSEAMVFMWRII